MPVNTEAAAKTHYYVIGARKERNGAFIAEPGETYYLKVPVAETPQPGHKMDVAPWLDEVRDLADGLADGKWSIHSAGRVPSQPAAGDVLFFVHGYNNSLQVIRDRQLQLQSDLRAEGWRGLVIAFDWPSNEHTLNYYEDRSDAAAVADKLVRHGIMPVAAGQQNGCETNIHLLGHSTGAYVIMEAFTQAERFKTLFKSDWRIAQVAFISGDVSRASLEADCDWAKPMLRRIMRLTNYSNGYDHVLAVSNAKRLGTAPRAGRVGLPEEADRRCVNVDCSEYFCTLDPQKATYWGTFAHSWHIGDRVFARDLAMTLEARFDRFVIATREEKGNELILSATPKGRPRYSEHWNLRGGEPPAK